MIELIEGLDAASSLLSIALEGYIEACSAIQTYYKQPIFTSVPKLLSDRITTELLSVTSYETSMKRAKSLISQARNYPSAITSIHSLPFECLIRIFEFVVDARPCGVKAQDNSGDKTSLPRYPDFLSHVCSRWRQIVTDLPALWAHIDIVHLHSLSQGFVDRAKACVARASPLPLEVHIRIPASHNLASPSTLSYFLESSASRTKSLELTVPSTFDDFDGSVLESFFESCIPGTLVQLTIVDGGSYAPGFLDATNTFDGDLERNIFWLFMPHEEFEDILLDVTALQLEGMFFRWKSQAYYGLVELRLTAKNTPDLPITRSELNHILTHSPGLRVLEFGLELVDRPSESLNSSDIEPVDLRDLELLILDALDRDQLGLFLGLLVPASRPMQIAFVYHNNTAPALHNETVLGFLTRSNIAMIRVKNIVSYPRLEELLDLLPHLQVLVLDEFHHRDIRRTSYKSTDNSVSPLPLEALYLLNSEPDLDKLRNTLEKRPVQKLIFWRSYVIRNLNDYVPEEQVRSELSAVCPVIKHVPYGGSNPIGCWD